MEDIFAKTTTTEKVIRITWQIENFLEALFSQGRSLSGPLVNMPTQPNTKWRTFIERDANYNLTFYAKPLDYIKLEKMSQIKYELIFSNTKGNALDNYRSTLSPNDTNYYITHYFVNCHEYEPGRNTIHKLLSEGRLSLVCCFRVIQCSTTCSVVPEVSPENDLSSLLDSFKTLHSSKTFSDFNIVVQDKTIPVHKCILSSRSPVFAAMLKSETLETQNNKLVIEDFDFKTMETFILYVYTGQLNELSTEEYLQLYSASDKYGLESLNKMCLRKLINCISVENVCDMFSLGYYHNDIALKNAAKTFLSKNAVSVLVSDNWKKMIVQNKQLATEMLKEIGLF